MSAPAVWGDPAELNSAVLRRIKNPTQRNDRRGAYTLERGADTNGPGGASRPYLYVDAERLLSLRWTWGRKSAGDPFESLAATFAYTVLDQANPAAVLSVGDELVLTIPPQTASYFGADDPNAYPYLLGHLYVTDIRLEYRRGDDRELVPVFTATATGRLARLGQTAIGNRPYFQGETVTNRLRNIINTAAEQLPGDDPFGWALSVEVPDNTPLRYVDVDHADAAGLMRALEADSGGYLYESAAYGAVTFDALEARRNRAPVVTLEAAELEDGLTWDTGLNGLCNKLTLTYGPEEARAEVTVSDEVSIARYGEYARGRETDLLNLADAQRLAQLIVGRSARPRWTVSELSFEVLRGLAPDKARELVYADIGALVEIVGLPSSAPAPRFYFVEGKEAEVTKHEWRLTVYLSEAGRTGAPIRWTDVNPGLTWAQATADDIGDPLTWLGAAGWFDQPGPTGGAFRWVDVPANQQWWHLDEYTFDGGATYKPELRDGDPRVPTWASYPNDP